MRGGKIVGLGAALGAFGIALGAFGAHGLREVLESNGERSVAAFDTAAQYHMYAALAIMGCGLAAAHRQCKGTHIAAGLLTAGAVLFSGSLYGLAVTQYRPLAFVTPVGGVLMLLGFVALAMTCFAGCGQACSQDE